MRVWGIAVGILAMGIALSSAGSLAQESRAPGPIDRFPMGERGRLIRLGSELVTNTRGLAPAFAKNGLNCTNCHLNAGRTVGAATFAGIWLLYPEYRSRNDRVNTLEDRLDDCFERSMNGKPLPAGSREKEAILAYIAWLSEGMSKDTARTLRGFPHITPSRAADPAKGQVVYEARCTACHGVDGGGTPVAPPLWGPQSYNIGAGMARVGLAAAFIKANMPLGQGGTLTDDEATDVSAYINSRPRPDFPGKARDWPKGDKPADVPY